MSIGIIDLIFQLKTACSAREEKIRMKLDLTPAEFRGILVLTPGSSVPCNIVSKKMGLSKSRCSRVIEKMMRNGYMKEALNNGDQRIMKVTLTTKGIKAQTKIHNMLQDCESSILKRMSKSELNAFENSMMKISDILISD
jgi:DNA-binding MarR family transcriptional regulator